MYDYRLPVVEVVKEAYRYAGREWLSLLRNALPLILLAVAVILFVVFLFLTAEEDQDGIISKSLGIGESLVPYAAVILGFAFAITYAVSVHRGFLLDSVDRGVLGTLYWRRRHWRFLGWVALVSVGMGLLSWLVLLVVGVPLGFLLDFLAIDMFFFLAENSFASEALSLLLWIPVIFIIGPAFLRLPDFAIDATDRSGAQALELARHNRGRLTGILLLGEFLPFLIFKYLIILVPTGLGALFISEESSNLLGGLLVGGAFGVLGLLYMISWLALTAVLLSVAYKHLRDNAPPPTETT